MKLTNSLIRQVARMNDDTRELFLKQNKQLEIEDMLKKTKALMNEAEAKKETAEMYRYESLIDHLKLLNVEERHPGSMA